ncbi:CRAL/TRIO domain-containing protein [Mycena sp. CBHHK59/15]|nr:CRAL/TRIO domain-containing protein [Mycena sp. CBHHK59/15]
MGDIYSAFDVFAGHLGHLSHAQEQSLAAFKDTLTKAELYKPGTDSTKPSHDDPTLLRFLRARSWDVSGARKQLADAEAWRRKHDVNNLYATFDPVEMENSRRFYPRWTGRRDKNGMPVYVYRLAALDTAMQKELSSATAERRYQRIIALYEAMRLFAMPMCSFLPHPTQTPITCVVTIIDLKDVSIGSMWTLRSHLSEASKLATANYPETLSTIAVVNAPSFFPTIWGWIKGWFDEGTRNKIHILGKSPGETLTTFIDPQDLPRQYGGELDWDYLDEPSLDAAAKEVISEMPEGPAMFVDGAVSRP